MPALLARGALRLSWILGRGEPLAALYSIAWNGKIHFYQGGRRVDLPAKLRPGIVAHAMAIELAIDERFREYDFLGGDVRYKLQLATASRPLVDLRAARRSRRERLRIAGERAIELARRARAAIRAARPAPTVDVARQPQ
jgi:CelD/BcsL family acetyltransferase involved in cellulose biosynthesis